MASHKNSQAHLQIVDFPQRVKILGNFTRVFIEGEEKNFSDLPFSKDKKTAPLEPSKPSKNTLYMIIPIQQKNSTVEFVKIPFYKLSSKLKANNIGSIQCERVNFEGDKSSADGIPRWVTKKEDFENAMLNTYSPEACFIFEQSRPRSHSVGPRGKRISESIHSSEGSSAPQESSALQESSSKSPKGSIKFPLESIKSPQESIKSPQDSIKFLQESTKSPQSSELNKNMSKESIVIGSKNQSRESLREALFPQTTQEKIRALNDSPFSSKDRQNKPTASSDTKAATRVWPYLATLKKRKRQSN